MGKKTEEAFNLLMKVKEYFSRKFLLAVSCLGLGYHLVLNGKEIGDWALVVAVVLGFYNGSNVVEKFAEIKTGKFTMTQKETMDGRSD